MVLGIFNIIGSIAVKTGGTLALYSPQYQQVLDYTLGQGWVPPPTNAGLEADDDMLREAIDINLFASAPRLWNYHTTGDSNYACINLKSPGIGTCTKISSPVFTNKAGFTTNGTSSCLNTFFNISTDGGGLYVLDDAGYILYNGIDGQVPGTDFGIVTYTQTSIRNSTTINFRMHTATNYGAGAPTNVDGLWIFKRISSTQVQIYRNGGLIGTSNTTSSALLNNTTPLGARRNATIHDSFTARRYDCFVPYKQSAVTVANIQTWWTNHRTRIAAV